MGAKLYADSSIKKLIMTEAPDINGFVYLNAQEEVWSDLIIDWENDATLRGHTFPVRAIGGDTISAGKLGTTYVLAEPWQIAPWEDDHDFVIDGNLFTELTLTKLVQPTAGPYTVTVTRNLSTLVEVVETAEASVIDAKLDLIADGVYGQKALIDAVDKYADPGYMILWDELGVLLGHKEIYEEHVLAGYPANIGYTRAGKGYSFEGPLAPGMPPP